MTKARALLAGLAATLDGRADVTETRLIEAARAAGYWMTADGRVGESDLAALLGMTPAGLANKRREGSAPAAYNLGGGGHRVTYRLSEVARWIEEHRESH